MLQNSVRWYLAAAQLPEVLADLCEMSRDYCAAIWQLWLGSRLLAEKHHRDKKQKKMKNTTKTKKTTEKTKKKTKETKVSKHKLHPYPLSRMVGRKGTCRRRLTGLGTLQRDSLDILPDGTLR